MVFDNRKKYSFEKWWEQFVIPCNLPHDTVKSALWWKLSIFMHIYFLLENKFSLSTSVYNVFVRNEYVPCSS